MHTIIAKDNLLTTVDFVLVAFCYLINRDFPIANRASYSYNSGQC